MSDGSVRRITWRTADVARVLSLAILFFFLWTFFWKVYTAVFLALIALLLAIILHAPAKLLSRRMPFRLAFALTLLAFFASLAALLVVLIPQILEQFAQLASQLPPALDSLRDWIRSRTGVPSDGGYLRGIEQQFSDFLGRFVPLAFNMISVVLGSFAVLILAIFLAVEPEVYRALLLRLVPPQSRDRAARIYDEAGRSLRNWVVGKACTMVAVGVVTWIGLSLFEIPGAIALASLAAVLEFIPNFGPTLAATPAVIAAFAISPLTALYVAIFYFVLQQVQSAITVPLVERRAVDIPPAALLIWQLMLAVGFGILGLFVATPLLAIIVVIGKVMYVEPTETQYAWDRRDASTPVPAAGAPPAGTVHPDAPGTPGASGSVEEPARPE
jgi:predicted PurR-regulated permease PerM